MVTDSDNTINPEKKSVNPPDQRIQIASNMRLMDGTYSPAAGLMIMALVLVIINGTRVNSSLKTISEKR